MASQRPSKISYNTRTTKVVTVAMPPGEKQALEDRARAEDRSQGAIMRRALREYLRKAPERDND